MCFLFLALVPGDSFLVLQGFQREMQGCQSEMAPLLPNEAGRKWITRQVFLQESYPWKPELRSSASGSCCQRSLHWLVSDMFLCLFCTMESNSDQILKRTRRGKKVEGTTISFKCLNFVPSYHTIYVTTLPIL